ncbi:MAG: MBL fold metallo-hydrolase [Robiginitomaculum sp.]|nr:MBL fold metallo-hydrolase [Robiginitomaculum sp.]
MSDESLTFRILGCGSSGGVPRIGNSWGVCDPDEPKNRRSRCSLLVSKVKNSNETKILVDTSPDMREQLLAAQCSMLDAVLYTHDHADQTHGLDDLRPISYMMGKKIPTFVDSVTRKTLLRRFDYAFQQSENSAYPAIMKAVDMPLLGESFDIKGQGGSISVIPFQLEHGPNVQALGFRFDSVVYTPDVSDIPDVSVDVINGCDVWIIDALRPEPHPTHFHLNQALSWIDRLKPKKAVLTNMHISMDYQMLREQLPANVIPAYDGMEIII